jgi:DNA-directed RNA polymerase beta subunit
VTKGMPDIEEPEPAPPEGVRLIDPEDSDAMRSMIEEGVSGAMQKYVHGYSYGGVRLELGNLGYAGKERFSLREQKDALLGDKPLYRRLRGDVTLVDEETNEVLDRKKNFTLARVPYLTQRGTFIHNGSEFAPIAQSRLLPGAYTRKRDNGELETLFNVRPGTGSTMRVSFDPQTAQYRLKIGSSDLHAYSVFRSLGVTDEELERRWGPEVLEANRKKYSSNVLDRVYVKAIPKWEREDTITAEEKVERIKESLSRAQAADVIMRRNLPNLYSREKAAHWRQVGRAIQSLQKSAAERVRQFKPDLSPDRIRDSWLLLEFGHQKSASDTTGAGSVRRLPEHWVDGDKEGWLSWYDRYHAGHRGEDDAGQIARWVVAREKSARDFVSRGRRTPEKAFELLYWGIDPVRLLPEEEAEQLQVKMAAHIQQEYVRWYLNTATMDERDIASLTKAAVARGASAPDGPADHGDIMRWALRGFIRPEDLS